MKDVIKTMMRKAGSLLASFACMGMAGCLSLDAPEDPTRFYTLSSPGAPPAPEGPTDVVVRTVELPEYLDSSSLVARRSAHQIRYFETHRWSGALDTLITDALTESLSRARPELTLAASPFQEAPAVLHIRILRFEALPEGDVEVSFDWRLTKPSDREILRSGRIIQRGDWEGKSLPALVEELASLLGDAAAELGSALPEAASI